MRTRIRHGATPPPWPLGLSILSSGCLVPPWLALFAAFPKELVACVAGIALFGTIANSLASALAVEQDREAALVTFLVTASGVSLAGIGSAF